MRNVETALGRLVPQFSGFCPNLTVGESGLVQQALVEQLYQQRIQPGAHEALLVTTKAAFGGNRQRIYLRETLLSLPDEVLVVWGNVDSVIAVAYV